MLELDSEADHDPDHNRPDIDDMLDVLQDLSDLSDPEMDNISVMSTPKPRLRSVEFVDDLLDIRHECNVSWGGGFLSGFS